jgi:hypothetical protein
MGKDYFAILGLTPGRYSGPEIARRFHSERARLLAQLNEPALHDAVCQRLDELHLAYAALRDPQGQERALRLRGAAADQIAALKMLIAASLEDGLLRYSRRQHILQEARQLGLSDFQAHLLIAEVQFADDDFAADWVRAGELPAVTRPVERRRGAGRRLVAAGVLALGIFVALVRWFAA